METPQVPIRNFLPECGDAAGRRPGEGARSHEAQIETGNLERDPGGRLEETDAKVARRPHGLATDPTRTQRERAGGDPIEPNWSSQPSPERPSDACTRVQAPSLAVDPCV